MVRRLIFISMALFIFSSNPAFVSATESPAVPRHTVKEELQQRILAATLRITMIARERSADEPAFVVSNGLGTLVQDGEATYIVTHDHWSRLARNVRAVRIESASGDVLLEMAPSRFYSLIRYRDGGTMVVAAPAALPDSVVPVAVADAGRPLADGDQLAIVYWQPDEENQVVVEPVSVEFVEEYDGNASIMLKSLNGQVVEQGNSGGGVFAGSELVGNMWETIRLRNRASGQLSASDLSRAARYTYEQAEQDEMMADFTATPARGGAF